ncbi:MAG: ferredoxin Fer [Haloarculaceae archaeon]
MPTLESVDGDDLRSWLDRVESAEAARWLMVAIAVDEGVPVDDLADWYGLPTSEIRNWVDELESEPLVVSVARREGVDFGAIAEAAGLGRETVVDWFGALESRPVDEAADIVRRYSRRGSGPAVSGTRSRVQYLDYRALEVRGWSVDDPDLFEKASAADLDSSEYGRFVVEAGETILEAAENRNISWPYACRGGACANCAAIVTEGDVAMSGQTVLTDEQVRTMNARLTCVGVPVTDELKLVMNVQHLDQFDDLRLPSPVAGAEPSI